MLFVSLRDLQWRRRRFVIGVLATGLVFALALLLSGIDASFQNEIGRAVHAFRADEWIVPSDVSGPFTSTRWFPAAQAQQIATSAGVRGAEPVVLIRTAVNTPGVKDINVVGITPGGIATPRLHDGRGLHGPGELVADSSLGLPVGAHVLIGSETFTIVGRTHRLTYFAGTPVVFAPIADLQKAVLSGAPLATAIVVDGHVGTLPN